MSNTLNFVLASPNDAADKIDEMEARIEALEAALRKRDGETKREGGRMCPYCFGLGKIEALAQEQDK